MVRRYPDHLTRQARRLAVGGNLSTGVSLTNSDPGLVLAFVKLLRAGYKLDESKWRVHLQIHDDQDFGALVDYWSK